ncbi:MAG: terminase TerL endonuclease subunit, partial [Planctomycetaceae bacterium]
KDREFYNSLLYSDSARVDSFACYITTAGDDLTSICYEEYERACRIRDGKDLSIDHLAVIYEAKKSAKFDDLKEWQRANPNYGVTLPERKIKRAIDQAKGSPQRIAALKRYRLNLWTKAKDGWIDPMRWDGLKRIDLDGISDAKWYGGLDLARVRDFAAFARVCKIDDVVNILVRLWIPQALILEKEQNDKIPLSDWIERGYVTATPGDEIDYGIIRKDILAMNAETPLEEIGYDPYNAAHLCNQELSAVDGLHVCEVPQTMPHMSGPSAEFERLMNAGKVRHEHNPALGWMVCNAITATDANENFRPIKKKSRGRIDGLIAFLIALSRMSAPSNPNRHNYYDNHEPELV